MKHGKKYVDSAKLIDKTKLYENDEAMDICVRTATAKFDETVEVHVKLGVDSRHADQQVRGAIVLPNGTGKKVKVLAICKGDNVKLAEQAGADFVGAEEMTTKIQNEGWMDFDVLITTPDMMGLVGRLGKVLGPRGLMPNPKAGTVTTDIAKAVKEAKAGKITRSRLNALKPFIAVVRELVDILGPLLEPAAHLDDEGEGGDPQSPKNPQPPKKPKQASKKAKQSDIIFEIVP